jgi:aryl-alcohol dehydrogenase-like predicted oxidoreductase
MGAGRDDTGPAARHLIDMDVVARQPDLSLPELAVALTLANPAVQVAIVGARRTSQLDGTALAAAGCVRDHPMTCPMQCPWPWG